MLGGRGWVRQGGLGWVGGLGWGRRGWQGTPFRLAYIGAQGLGRAELMNVTPERARMRASAYQVAVAQADRMKARHCGVTRAKEVLAVGDACKILLKDPTHKIRGATDPPHLPAVVVEVCYNKDTGDATGNYRMATQDGVIQVSGVGSFLYVCAYNIHTPTLSSHHHPPHHHPPTTTRPNLA